MTIAERIRFARQAAGLTQKQLGERAGIAEPTIRKYELEKLNPKRSTLEKIANAVELSIDFFIGVNSFTSIEELLDQKNNMLQYFKDWNLVDKSISVNELSDYQYFKLISTLPKHALYFLFYSDDYPAEGSYAIDAPHDIKNGFQVYVDLTRLTLLSSFATLNEKGKRKVIDLVAEIANNPEYQRKDVPKEDKKDD